MLRLSGRYMSANLGVCGRCIRHSKLAIAVAALLLLPLGRLEAQAPPVDLRGTTCPDCSAPLLRQPEQGGPILNSGPAAQPPPQQEPSPQAFQPPPSPPNGGDLPPPGTRALPTYRPVVPSAEPGRE